MSKKSNKTSKQKSPKASEKKGLGKGAKTLIIALVSLAALVGVFLLVYFVLPQQEDPKENHDTESESSEYDPLETHAEYPLVNHVPADIEKIEVENETGKFTLLSETPTTEVTASDGTVSEATEATVYTLVGYEDMELLLGTPDMLANDAAALTAGKIVNDGSKKSDFGFDKPRATVKTTFKGGEVSTVTVGDDAPDSQGTYVMVNDDKNVYLVQTDNTDGFLLGAMGMLSTEIGSAASEEANNVFSKMVFGGELFGGDVEFVYANDDNFSETYRIVTPDKVLANEEVVTYMINNVRNLKAKEVVAVNADSAKLKEYGLDAPWATVNAEYPDLKVSYKASKPDKSGDFYLESKGIIYKMSTESVPWVLNSYSECAVKSVIRPKYGRVTGMTVEADGKSYKFDIKTETKVEGDTTKETTTVSCGGAVIDEDKFSVFYQNAVSAERSGIIDKPEGKKPILTVTYEFENGKSAKAEYYEGANRKCPVVIDGGFASEAFESYVTKMISDTPIIASNGSVESIY